ncbi:MAG: nascent polypeptide-associated complex protein [Candidatus Nanohaloarchaea archaeon]
MSKMMKQMGMDMDEIDADRVVVEIGDKKMVFEQPQLSKISVQGQDMFQLQGEFTEEKIESGPSDEDVELVMEKTEASREEAEKALEENEDVAAAVMDLQ